MTSNGLEKIGKIGEFIKKYTGSGYNYSSPSGAITDNYKQIGEVFGFPVWMDDNKRYENEYLDFPNLGDALSSIANTGISFDIKVGECSVCLVINFTIPLVEYPPIIICLSKPECKKKPKEDSRDCIPPSEWEDYLNGLEEEYNNWDQDEDANPDFSPAPKKPMCPEDDQGDDIQEGKVPGSPGQCYQWRWHYFFYQSGSGIKENIIQSVGGWNTICAGDYFNPYQFPEEEGESGSYFGAIQTNDQWDFNIFSNYKSPRGSAYLWKSIRWKRFPNPGSDNPYLAWGITRDSHYIEWHPDTPSPYKSDSSETDTIPDPSGNNMNNCCDDIKKLLARNERLLKEIHKVINPEQFFRGDVQVPNSWIYPGHSPNPVKADDIPDAISMILRMLDRRIGYMPQAIQIKDANPDIEGDQGKSLIVNSLADLCKHIFEFQINAGREEARVNKALLKMGGATLYESGTTHQLAIVMERMLLAVTEYLDFEAGYKKEKFKMYFDPTKQLGKDNLEQHLDGLIKGHNQPIEVMEWKGGSSGKDKLNEILQKVSLCAAALSTTKPLEETIQEAKDLARVERMLIVKEFQDRDGIPDLKEFNDDAEKGYPSSIRSPSVKANPYGFGSGEPKLKRTTSKSKRRKYTNKAKAKQ